MSKILLTGLLLSLCGIAVATEAPIEITMEETHWQLVKYLDSSGEATPVLPKPPVDMKLSDGELGGSAGCNRYFGSYEIEGDQLLFTSQMGSTQMACAPPIAEQEHRYLALLPQATSWKQEKRHLTLIDKDGRPILRYTAVEPTALENTEWQAGGINNGKGGVASTGSTGLSTATFTDATVSGSGGCNRYNAAYEIEGDHIGISPAAATRKFCAEPEGIMDQERQFFAALGRARTYQVTPGKLELRDEKGSLQISFRAKSE